MASEVQNSKPYIRIFGILNNEGNGDTQGKGRRNIVCSVYRQHETLEFDYKVLK